MEHVESAPVVVLSPHLDDAVLSAWSAIAGERDALVVNVFVAVPESGPPPRWDLLAGATDRRTLQEARLEEDREALALAGTSAVHLTFLDRHYRDSDPTLGDLAVAIEAAVPAASVLYAPSGIGGHVDHLLVRDAALRLRMPLRLYAELPYAVRFGWPGWVRGEPGERGPADADWDHWLRAAPVDFSPDRARVTRLDDAEASAKLAAMRSYRTQFPLLNQGPLGVLEHPEVLPLEVAWDVDLSGRG